jgi:DNA mismatch repair protein MutS
MDLDYSTKRNLELTETMRTASKKGSLLWVLDDTASPVGARTLRRWLSEPLLDTAQISARHDALAELIADPIRSDDIHRVMSNMSDIQRLASKVSYRSISGRELLALRDAIFSVPRLMTLYATSRSRLLVDTVLAMDDLTDIGEMLDAAISEDAGTTAKDGNLVKAGYDDKIDELRALAAGAKGVLLEIEARERDASNIRNLRVKYNKVFGYYFEVTKSNLASVPAHFIRKQTLVNAERFYTEELKDLEGRLLSAGDDLLAREAEIYADILASLAVSVTRIQETARLMGVLDVLNSLARVSRRNRYVQPELNEDGVIDIKGGRHPVVEQLVPENAFIPNDAYLDNKSERMLIITGPNMAGKSTFIRQVAIIALMCQVGCFVPAQSASLCVVDKILTRVGASDDIASGQSTFMVEMGEVSNILKNATSRSLVILDEVGRGTSTFDGLSIARAVLEHLNDKETIGSKSLFATHYHELTELEGSLEGVVNHSIRLAQSGEDVVFTHEVVRGPADKSYGIEVAKLAGLPGSVIARAQEVLDELEASPKARKGKARPRPAPAAQVGTANLLNYKRLGVLDELRTLPVNDLTPIEVMAFVAKLQKDLASDG